MAITSAQHDAIKAAEKKVDALNLRIAMLVVARDTAANYVAWLKDNNPAPKDPESGESAE